MAVQAEIFQGKSFPQ